MVQSVSGTAASEAIQILWLLCQQGGGVGGLLGAAGAAEAIVAAALARSDIDPFDTIKYASYLQSILSTFLELGCESVAPSVTVSSASSLELRNLLQRVKPTQIPAQHHSSAVDKGSA